MPTTVKTVRRKNPCLQWFTTLEACRGDDFKRSEPRIALGRAISRIRSVPGEQIAVMYVTPWACTVRAQFGWMCRHEI